MNSRIPQAFIDRVLERTDLVDLIDQRVKLKHSGRNYTACCPFHQERTPSFTVSREKQFYYCFGCSASGNAISFLMEYEHQSFIEALRQLASPLGMELPRAEEVVNDTTTPLYTAIAAACQFYRQQLRQHPQRQRAVDYLQQRGLSGDIARDFGLGYAPPGWDHLARQPWSEAQRQALIDCGLILPRKSGPGFYDAMRDRVIFPIRDLRGRSIGLGGRVLNDDKPKYLNSPESPIFHKGQELYGLYEARQHGKLARLLVVEGYMDVIALAQHGLHFAVATLGTATTPQHIERLLRQTSEILFCFDGDDAGRRAAWKAVQACLPALTDGQRVAFMFLEQGEDPDSLVRRIGAAGFAALMEQAQGLADFLFAHQSADLQLQRLEDKAQLAQRVRALIEPMPPSIYRQLFEQRLREVTGLEAATPPALEKKPATATVTPAPKRRVARAMASARHGLCDKALRLLMLNPGLAARLHPPDLDECALEHWPLLRAVLDMLQRHPQMSNAGLLGAWHGSNEGEELAALAAHEFLLTPSMAEGEIEDIDLALRRTGLEHQLKRLTEAVQEQPSRERLEQQWRLRHEIEQLRRRRPTPPAD